MAASSSSSWHADYLSALRARDTREKQYDDIITAYTSLAARGVRTSHLMKLQQRCRDLEEEVKTKDRLLQQAQDDLVVSGMELTMCEKRVEELKRDNQELTDRWMEQKRAEAEEMNQRGGFGG